MKKLTVHIGSTTQTQELRSGDFFLMPQNPIPPVIVSNLNKNVRQKTWIGEYVEGQPSYLEVIPAFGIYEVLVGTEIEMFILAEDPSLVSLNEIGNDKLLQYVWKKDDAPITAINALNNGKGIPGINIPATEVNANTAGIYTCEVSNAYGTTTSSRVRLKVLEPKKHPKIFRNLLKNGSSKQNWKSDSDIITRAFVSDQTLTGNFGSLPNFMYYDMTADRVVGEGGGYPDDFRFCLGGHSSLLYPMLQKWSLKDRDLFKIDTNSNPEDALEGWEVWNLHDNPSHIVPNEDLEYRTYAGFFPGLRWMDAYNKNTEKVIGLVSEIESQALTYITRDKIKFKKNDGKESSTVSQVVELNDLDTIIDGQVMGMTNLNGQFFCYVGAGITGYKIRVLTTDGEQTFNWYVSDPDDFFKRLASNADDRPTLVEGSVIDIIPLMEDTTQITITTRSASGFVLSSVDIEGPTVEDVFAIKEKAQLPLTWYPIFEMLKTNNNEIHIFGQKYSTTNALGPLTDGGDRSIIGYNYTIKLDGIGTATIELVYDTVRSIDPTIINQLPLLLSSGGEFNLKNAIVLYNLKNADYPITATTIPGESLGIKDYHMQIVDRLTAIGMSARIISYPIYDTDRSKTVPIYDSPMMGLDRNAAFFIKKVKYNKNKLYYPGEVGAAPWDNLTGLADKRKYRALNDRGAAAMFAVGTTFLIPKNTRSVEVSIKFTHNSEAMDDGQFEMKGWDKSEIYRNDFGSKKLNSKRFVEYGYPRCGVTMAKLIITDNSSIDDNHASYSIPPANFTVLGLRKQKLYSNTNDTSEPGDFENKAIMPQIPPPPIVIDLYHRNDNLQSYERELRKREGDAITSITQEEIDRFTEGVVGTEDAAKDRPENISEDKL